MEFVIKEDDTKLQNKHDLYQIMRFVYMVITGLKKMNGWLNSISSIVLLTQSQAKIN